MPGYARTRIVGLSSGDLEEFICGICRKVFNKPTVTQCCGQTFCNDCITEWLDENIVCPYDRKRLDKNQLLIAPKVVTNLLNELEIECEYNEMGCQTVVRLGDLEKHQATCKFNPYLVCAKCGSGNHSEEKCFQEQVKEHRKRQIQMRFQGLSENLHHFISCNGCKEFPIHGIRYKCTICKNYNLCESCENVGFHSNLEKHQATCKFNPYLVCAKCGSGNHSEKKCFEEQVKEYRKRQIEIRLSEELSDN